ncbi:glutathione transferase [Ranunculus cassubicifolius]
MAPGATFIPKPTGHSSQPPPDLIPGATPLNSLKAYKTPLNRTLCANKTQKDFAFLSIPFQETWICLKILELQGLQKEIKLVPLDLQNRPAWYKEEVYPLNKVPALEHKNKIIGESLDLIKYLDSNFDGPSLYPKDAAKKEFVDELLNHTDTFTENAAKAFKGEPGTDIGSPFDYLENKLSKYGDGPFFLGSEFSLADIAYAPFVEGYQLFLENVKNYHLEAGRPKLAAWIEAMNKKEAYTQTKHDPKVLLEMYKRKFASA